MTLMLASVTNEAEAEAVSAGGADIIDLKDPAKGALGALATDAVAQIVRALSKSKPVSAAVDAAGRPPHEVAAAVAAMAATGVDYVKVALPEEKAAVECVRLLRAQANETRLVGVLFADEPPALDMLPLMAENGFAGAMLDTAKKGAGRLLDHMDVAGLDRFIGRCRKSGLMAGLAGSLEAPDVPRLLPLQPDYLGFRGSLCQGRDREASIDATAVRLIRDLIPRHEASARASGAEQDWRLSLAGAFVPFEARSAGTDRIFVHDLVLPCAIGAYDSERGRLQNVRFNIDIDVRRVEHPSDDIRSVFSYDVIIDTIKLIVSRGHIDLIETLASAIADEVLHHPAVMRIWVRVEKLDVVRGAVGIEIKRERVAEAAALPRHLPLLPGNAA